MDIATPLDHAAAEIIYRCHRCGIESVETTCFVGLGSKGTPSRKISCVTCAGNDRARAGGKVVFGTAVFICLPVFFVTTRRISDAEAASLFFAGCFMWPLLIFLHELGHFLTAKLLGLKSNLIVVGAGPKLWSGRLFRLPLRIHAFPSLGLTYLGADSLKWLRLRLWLTALMGPTTHIALIALALSIEPVHPRPLTSGYFAIWIMYNALMFAFSIMPFRTRSAGASQSDGLRLVTLPRSKPENLRIYLSSAALGTAISLYNEGDYAGGRDTCLDGLRHQPQSEWLLLMLSACQIQLADYQSARTTIQKVGDLSQLRPAALRAAFMANFATNESLLKLAEPALTVSAPEEIERFSEQSFRMFPCDLGIRAARAHLLADTGRAQNALELLDYSNFLIGSVALRAAREAIRAFAFRQLGREADAANAVEAALTLSKSEIPYLTAIGLLPASTENPA
jgi:tetratricopeptide (TPR) repeat protein